MQQNLFYSSELKEEFEKAEKKLNHMFNFYNLNFTGKNCISSVLKEELTRETRRIWEEDEKKIFARKIVFYVLN